MGIFSSSIDRYVAISVSWTGARPAYPLRRSLRTPVVFPSVPRAASVFFNRLSLTSNWRRKRAFSAWSADSFPIDSPGFFPARTPASRSRRHSVICEEYSPSRRRNAPPSLFSHAFSYAAKNSSFCTGVNDRRGRSDYRPAARNYYCYYLTALSSRTALKTGLDMITGFLALAPRD